MRIISYLFFASIFLVQAVWIADFHHGYYFPKKIFIAFIMALSGFFLLRWKKIYLPPRPILFATIALLVLKVIGLGLVPTWVTAFNFLEAVSLGIFILFLMTAWEQEKFELQNFFWVFTISGYSLALYVIWQYVIMRILNANTNPYFFSAPFGNINMLTEYMIFLFPLGWYFQRENVGFKLRLTQLLLIFWIFIMVIGQSRSVWLGLTFCIGYAVFKKLNRNEIATIVIATGLIIASLFIPSQGQNYSDAKKESFVGRAEIYRGTLKMLADQPLGVGGGGFEYNYLPYQLETKMTPKELVRFESPHNEFIKWGIENGWAFLLVNILWWSLVGYFVFRITATATLSTFYRTSFAVLIPQVLFQFPFDNPASIAVIAFIFAVIFRSRNSVTLNFSVLRKIAVTVVSILILAKSTSQAFNKWIDSYRPQEKVSLKLGCEIDPTNWRVCFLYESLVLESSYAADVIPIIKSQLRERPYEFHALRNLGIYHFANGQTAQGCEIALVYDTLFKNDSYFTPIIQELCKNAKTPVPFENSVQFNEHYRQWLKTLF